MLSCRVLLRTSLLLLARLDEKALMPPPSISVKALVCTRDKLANIHPLFLPARPSRADLLDTSEGAAATCSSTSCTEG